MFDIVFCIVLPELNVLKKQTKKTNLGLTLGYSK